MPTSAPAKRLCKLTGCTVIFTPPKGAENKEFCCASHRYQFHQEQRKAGLALLAKQQEGKVK